MMIPKEYGIILYFPRRNDGKDEKKTGLSVVNLTHTINTGA
jgi:hypothetical protein